MCFPAWTHYTLTTDVDDNVFVCVFLAAKPISTQPGGQAQWMAAPAAIPGVPAGLEYLTHIDQLLVHQQIEVLERECLQNCLRLDMTPYLCTVVTHVAAKPYDLRSC